MFCDEPTTGLDSYGALTVVRTLREVAARGKIVVCSVHQPASGLLDIFHEVLLLSGGRVAFQGSSVDATQFFDRSDSFLVERIIQYLVHGGLYRELRGSFHTLPETQSIFF